MWPEMVWWNENSLEEPNADMECENNGRLDAIWAV